MRSSESFTWLLDFPDEGPLLGVATQRRRLAKKQLLPYLTALIARAV